jgi:hypothetical protein
MASIVAFDTNGHPSFQLLQNTSKKEVRLAFVAFDLLNFDGRSLLKLCYSSSLMSSNCFVSRDFRELVVQVER